MGVGITRAPALEVEGLLYGQRAGVAFPFDGGPERDDRLPTSPAFRDHGSRSHESGLTAPPAQQCYRCPMHAKRNGLRWLGFVALTVSARVVATPPEVPETLHTVHVAAQQPEQERERVLAAGCGELASCGGACGAVLRALASLDETGQQQSRPELVRCSGGPVQDVHRFIRDRVMARVDQIRSALTPIEAQHLACDLAVLGLGDPAPAQTPACVDYEKPKVDPALQRLKALKNRSAGSAKP